MKDVYTESLISERKLLWDEENRLRAICDNGYVSSYLYDASGERTVKLSGHNEAVFVNADTAGNIVTQTNKFTIYPDAYNVYSSNGRRTKHIYIGSERIASTVSADTTYNPIIVTWAGGGSFSSEINSKYSLFTNGVADIYSEFELPYNGSDNNNFIPAQVMSLASGVEVASANTGNDLDEYEYFYHSDHLGSTSYVTDANGEVSQHVEYVPFGEVFIEELSSSAKLNTPYLFNGKELDEETGLYYYGARYYDPRTSLWLSTDPMELKYPNISTYAYCANNPINIIDPSGRKILFVNGYWNSSFIGSIIGSKHAKEKYWSTGFASAAKNFFKDYSQINSSNYIDGSSQWGGDMSGQDRYNAGYKYAMNNLNSLTSGLAENESFNIVTHSEGSAFGAGVAQALLENGYSVSTVVHLSSDEGDEFTTPQSPYTIQLSYEGDWITNNHKIKNVDIFGIVNKGGNSWNTVHGKTKSSDVFKTITDLLNVKLEENIGMKDGKFHHWYKQVEGTAPNGTKFYRIDNKNVE